MHAGPRLAAYFTASLQSSNGSEQQLTERAISMFASVGAAKQPATWAAYRPLITQYLAFCEQLGLPAEVACPKIAALFLDSQFKQAMYRGVGYAAVERASSAVTAYFAGLQQTSPCTTDPLCRMVCKAAKNTLVGQKCAREPVLAADLLQVVQHHIKPGCPLETRMHVTVMVLCFSDFLRFGDAANILVHQRYLQVSDAAVTYYLWRSKTDPEGAGEWRRVPATHGPACPVRMVRELLAAGRYKTMPTMGPAPQGGQRELEDVGPLLRSVDSSGALALVTAPLETPIPSLAYHDFLYSMRRLLQQAGIHKPVGTHSFRKGAATEAMNAGADPALVQRHGRWKDAKVFNACYVQVSDSRMATVPQAAGRHLL